MNKILAFSTVISSGSDFSMGRTASLFPSWEQSEHS